jgi:hypothetical protein
MAKKLEAFLNQGLFSNANSEMCIFFLLVFAGWGIFTPAMF